MSVPSSFLSPEDATFAAAMVRLGAANPFLAERIVAERAVLGPAFREEGAQWNRHRQTADVPSNTSTILDQCTAWLARVQATWPAGGRVRADESELYRAVGDFWLFHAYAARFDALIASALGEGGASAPLEFYGAFKKDVERLYARPGLQVLEAHPVPHLFACTFQIRRAFHNIHHSLVGSSAVMAQLRAAIWQSIFSHDLERYRRQLYARMGDFATLVQGPSGSGKELVARALALSQYVPYEPRRGGFVGDFAAGYFPLNLAALSPTLIESELLGHRRGAFTGALADRAGWMEVCPPTGAVFLDEIGEVETGIQIKLLRVLQTRTFQPLGGTESRKFAGKVIAATHRDLPAAIRAGRFREDFYYRLCSDQLTTPALRVQLDDAPGDLAMMVEHIAGKLFAPTEAVRFTHEAVAWMEKNLGPRYPWPGNFRELEQCVRNLVLRGEYRPAGTLVAEEADWNALIGGGRLQAAELLRRYIRLVHAQAGSIEATARRLDLDRRTVRARLRD